MLEALLGGGKVTPAYVVPADTGAGPSTLIAGDASEGYFGTLTAANFINGTALASAISLTAGSAISGNVNDDWMKFMWKGKVLFSPMRGFRSTITWNQLYAAGAVHGDDTVGPYPPATQVAQSAKVTIAGKVYRVRLFSTSTKTAVNLEVGTGSGSSGRNDDSTEFKGSEYNQLIYRSCNDTDPATQVGADWAAFSGTALSAGWLICQETTNNSGRGMICRSYPGFGIKAGLVVSRGLSAASVVWKPVLELVNP